MFDWITVRALLIAPICEEIVFRKFVIDSLKADGYSYSMLVYFSPLLFGLSHLHHGVSEYLTNPRKNVSDIVIETRIP